MRFPSPFTTRAAGAGWSSGNQSGGLRRSSICAGVYCLLLPGTVCGVAGSAGSDPACTWNAHDGSRGTGEGNAVGVAAGGCCEITALDSTVTRQAMRASVLDMDGDCRSFESFGSFESFEPFGSFGSFGSFKKTKPLESFTENDANGL